MPSVLLRMANPSVQTRQRKRQVSPPIWRWPSARVFYGEVAWSSVSCSNYARECLRNRVCLTCTDLLRSTCVAHIRYLAYCLSPTRKSGQIKPKQGPLYNEKSYIFTGGRIHGQQLCSVHPGRFRCGGSGRSRWWSLPTWTGKKRTLLNRV